MDDMKIGVLAVVVVLFAMSAPVKADGAKWDTLVFPSGDGALSLSKEPCTVPEILNEWEKVRTQAKVQYNLDVEMPKQSRLLWRGKVYASCYVENDGVVYNIDSLLERLRPIPRELFVPHEGALPAGSAGA